MSINRDLYPKSPEFRREMVVVLTEICRYLLQKQRQDQENEFELSSSSQEINNEVEAELPAINQNNIE